MPSGDACLLDSNILLRISKNDDPQNAAISYAPRALVGQRVRLCYTSQTLGEFWNASTRPLDKNGFGLSVAETDRLARVIEQNFELLPAQSAACVRPGCRMSAPFGTGFREGSRRYPHGPNNIRSVGRRARSRHAR